MNVLRRAVDDRVDAPRRKRDARALVIPQTLRVQQIDTEEKRDEQRDEEPEFVFVSEECVNHDKSIQHERRTLQRIEHRIQKTESRTQHKEKLLDAAKANVAALSVERGVVAANRRADKVSVIVPRPAPQHAVQSERRSLGIITR